MPHETIETTTTGPGKTITKWWSGSINIQTVVLILGAFASTVLFWKDSHDNWDKTGKLEEVVNGKASAEDLKVLKEQVNRQYTTEREQHEKEDAKIEEALDWIEFQKGYQKRAEEEKQNK